VNGEELTAPREVESFGLTVASLGNHHLYRVLVTAEQWAADHGEYDELLVVARDADDAERFAAEESYYGDVTCPGRIGGVELLMR
jgi:hypothetical protein